jgi:hypothetical protein
MLPGFNKAYVVGQVVHMATVVVDEDEVSFSRFGVLVYHVQQLLRLAFAFPARNQLNHGYRPPFAFWQFG